MEKTKKDHLLLSKLSYTAWILLVYLLGRRIVLYGIDQSQYHLTDANAEAFLGMALGGDIRKISVFALGISPYMLASILVMVVSTIRRAISRSKTSIRRTNQALWIICYLFAVYQAMVMVTQLHFDPAAGPAVIVEVTAGLQMIAGAMLILWLSEQNKEFGIGGQSVLILVNILESMIVMVSGCSLEELMLPAACALAAMLITLNMEQAEFRMPVQRISIHNIYADKNYIAVKLNPVGVLPAVFATAVFNLLQMALVFTRYLLRDVTDLQWLVDKMSFTEPVGVGVYIGIIYILTIVFSLILVAPGEMAEQLLKSNDSLCNIPSGKKTKRYLTRVVLILSLISATVMSVCVAGPLVWQFYGDVAPGLMMLPSVVMMLTGVCVNVYREFETVISFDSYWVFL